MCFVVVEGRRSELREFGGAGRLTKTLQINY